MTDAKETVLIDQSFFDALEKGPESDGDRLFGPCFARCQAHIIFAADLPLAEEDRLLAEKQMALGPCVLHVCVEGEEMLSLLVHAEQGQVLGLTPVPSHLRPEILAAAQELVGMFVGQAVSALYTYAVGGSSLAETATAAYVLLLLKVDALDALRIATAEQSKLSKKIEQILTLDG